MNQLIDISLVKKAANEKPAKIVELLQLYIHSLDSDVEALFSLLDDQGSSSSETRKIVHRVNGAAKMVGAQHLVDACSKLERVKSDDVSSFVHDVINAAQEAKQCVVEEIEVVKAEIE